MQKEHESRAENGRSSEKEHVWASEGETQSSRHDSPFEQPQTAEAQIQSGSEQAVTSPQAAIPDAGYSLAEQDTKRGSIRPKMGTACF